MTIEDDFQAALDSNPDDWHTRLVFADWLDEQGDPRGPGYRALGVQRRRSYVCGFDNNSKGEWLGAGWVACESKGDEAVFTVPKDWFDAIEGLGNDPRYRPRYEGQSHKSKRREVEDAAARGFALLPPARRAELLVAPAGS